MSESSAESSAEPAKSRRRSSPRSSPTGPPAAPRARPPADRVFSKGQRPVGRGAACRAPGSTETGAAADRRITAAQCTGGRSKPLKREA